VLGLNRQNVAATSYLARSRIKGMRLSYRKVPLNETYKPFCSLIEVILMVLTKIGEAY